MTPPQMENQNPGHKPLASEPTIHSSTDASQVFQQARDIEKQIANFSLHRRAEYLGRFRQTLLKEQDRVLDHIQQDTGKARFDAMVAEIFAVLDFVEFLEKDGPKLLQPESIKTPLVLMPRRSKIFYEPLGTILAIAPWNYPFYTGIIPCLSGFMAGNAVILKPSEFTPLKGLIESLFDKAGFHPHWVQVIYGDGKLGSKLIDCKPDKIFFTGSTATGKKIMKQAADHLIPVGLELGGKDPMIVFNDANVERATSGAMWGGFCNAGQTCTSVERLYVQSGIYDAFVKRITQKTKKLTLGTEKQGDTDLGHITTAPQLEIIKDHLNDAKEKGATQLTGEDWDGHSNYIPATLLADVPTTAKILTEETFGPIIPIIKFEKEDEAVELANKSEYGLSASVWGANKTQLERVARKIVTGNVSVNNVMLTQGNPHLPFGGTKQSGFGRTKGAAGLRAFTNAKSVIFDSNSSKVELNWHPYTKEKYARMKKVIGLLFSGDFASFAKGIVQAIKLEGYSSKLGKKGR